MLETIPNTPIVNAGLLYVNGLQIANTSTSVDAKTLILTAGMARDSRNVSDIVLSSNVIIDGRAVGPNGVDSSPLVASKFYAVYVIGDSTNHHPTAGLFSLATNSEPFLPSGYDMFRRVGWILTSGGSGTIVFFTQLGIDQNRTYYYQISSNVLTTGTSTNYAFIDLSAIVPPITQPGLTATINVFVDILYTPLGAINAAQFHYNIFSSPPPPIVIFGCGTALVQSGTLMIPSQNQKIAYKVQPSDSLSVNVFGYTDYLI